MQLALQHLKGIRGTLGSVFAHPTIPGGLVYVNGGQVVLTNEADLSAQQLLRGHTGPITAFALSPQGRFVASGQGGKQSDVLLWDVESRRLLTRFSEHDEEVVFLTFSHDDRLLLTAGHEEKDQKLFLLDTSTGKIVAKTVMGWRKRVTAAAFAHEASGNTYSCAAATDNEVTLFTLDPYSGALSQRKVVTGSVRRTFTSMVFSRDGAWLYAGTTSGDIVTINVLRAAVQLVHPACGGGIGGMVLSSSGRLLVGGGDGSITVFSNDHMWRDMRPFVTVPGSITSLSPNCDGSALIVGTAQGAVLRVASGSFAVSTVSQGHTRGVTRVAFVPGDPTSYASSSHDGTVCIWGAQDQLLQAQVSAGPTAGPALSLALTPDTVITGWGDGTLRAHVRAPPPTPLIDPVTGVYTNGHAGSPYHTHHSPHKTQARAAAATAATTAAVSINGSTLLPQAWSVPGAHSLAHSCGVTALKVANRGHFIASGGAGGELRVWDMRTREMVAHMKGHTAPINEMAVLADDAHLVAVSDDRQMSAWDIGAQKGRATWQSASALKALAVAPDQVTLVTGGTERHVTVWDLRAPDPVHVLYNAHEGDVGAVAVAPGGSVLATGGAEGVVKLWDLRAPPPAPNTMLKHQAPPPSDRYMLALGAAHTAPVTSLVFDPAQPSTLMSAAMDGGIATWSLLTQ